MVKGVFAGLTGLDITYYQTEIPEENFKSRTNDYDTFIGGPAANAAITYAILGGDATLLTCLGDSVIAKSIKTEFKEEYGVKVIDLAKSSKNLPSISSILVHTGHATRTIWSGQQQFTNIDVEIIEETVRKASFCFSDCNLPEVTIPFLNHAAFLQKRIVLDPGSWKPHFPKCLPLGDEVIASVNCKPEGDIDLVTFLKRENVKKIAITDGERITHWYDEGKQGIIKVPHVEAVDTLAAGDVLHGAFCYYRFDEEKSFVEAMKKATIVASESVKYYGAREGVYRIRKTMK